MARLITGATGFIGSTLVDQWLSRDLEEEIYALTRSPQKVSDMFSGRVLPIEHTDEISDKNSVEVIVNLAGEPILDKRWSEQRKNTLYDSRINLTRQLVDFVQGQEKPVKVFVSGSAIGYYGNQPDDQLLNENGATHPCFAHKLCIDWENVASQLADSKTRVCLLRTGVVIGDGGALAKMLLPFKLGLGGPIASGQQWMSWIDIEDMVKGIDYLIDHSTLQGPFNFTAPKPVRNVEFTKTLAEQLGRPAFFPMPAFVLHTMLGEGAELLVEGQRVIPEKLLEAGFEFKYPTLKQSLANTLN